MRILPVPPLLVLLAAALRAAGPEPNTLTPAEQAAGWKLLFDGHTTTGWTEVTGKPFPASWTIEDGCLRSLAMRSMQDLRTTDTYRNFELRWEWKIAPGGNSGVKYLVKKTDEWTNSAGRQARARGLEYQLYDDDSDGEGAGDPTKQCGALYGLRTAIQKVPRPVGEFNESRLIVDGRRVEHWLNGVLVAGFSLDEPDVRKVTGPVEGESYLSLQNHGGLTWFRNIKVRKW